MNHTCDKGLTFKIYNKFQQLNRKVIKKWAKDLNRYFSKEDMQITKEYVERCSILLTMRKMQIITTMRYHFTGVKTDNIKTKTKGNKCQQGYGEIETLAPCRLVGM